MLPGQSAPPYKRNLSTEIYPQMLYMFAEIGPAASQRPLNKGGKAVMDNKKTLPIYYGNR
jgi:hypothetical protein